MPKIQKLSTINVSVFSADLKLLWSIVDGDPYVNNRENRAYT